MCVLLAITKFVALLYDIIPWLVELSSPQFSSRASSSKIWSQFWAQKGHRCNPKNLRISFTPMTPSKSDPRPPKKNFLIYFFITYIRNFSFRGAQIENANFFLNPQTSKNLQKSTLLIKISSKWPEKKIFLYIRKGLI